MAEFDLESIIKSSVEKALNTPVHGGKSITEWAAIGMKNGGGWISVKDALPMLDEEVLVYAIGKIEPFIGKHVFALCNRYIQCVFPSAPGYIMWSSPWQYFHTDYEITHWMPLPEPPEEAKP